jgi:hypothetical protein
MHLLKYFITFASDLWFEFFGDFAGTASQNSPSSLLDSVTAIATSTDNYRSWSHAVLLRDQNKVFIIPQLSSSTPSSGLLYDIATDSYSSSSATFTLNTNGVSGFVAAPAGVVLDNGKVLISPGTYSWFNGGPPSTPFHLYNPIDDTLQTIASPFNNGFMRDMCKLPNGKVFCLAYNYDGSTNHFGYIFDPDTLSFTITPVFDVNNSLQYRNLILLPNGKLIITSNVSNAKQYDYLTNTYTTTSLPPCSSAGLMHDGRIFYMRGNTLTGFIPTVQDSNGYAWDPNNGAITTFSGVFTFETGNSRDYSAGILMLCDGRMLLSVYPIGDNAGRYHRMFNPSTGTTTSVSGSLIYPLGYESAAPRVLVPLTNGKVLYVTSQRRAASNKFQVISGAFSTAIQFPTRQLKGGYLPSNPIYRLGLF